MSYKCVLAIDDTINLVPLSLKRTPLIRDPCPVNRCRSTSFCFIPSINPNLAVCQPGRNQISSGVHGHGLHGVRQAVRDRYPLQAVSIPKKYVAIATPGDNPFSIGRKTDAVDFPPMVTTFRTVNPLEIGKMLLGRPVRKKSGRNTTTPGSNLTTGVCCSPRIRVNIDC